MKIVILGARGMLGQELVKVFQAAGHAVTAWDRAEIDITAADAPAKINAAAPELILNCVAFNNVDACEAAEGWASAAAVNGVAPSALAAAAHTLGATFVHFSSDYVFAGVDARGYDETAVPAPVNKYGESKLAGERAVMAIYENAAVVENKTVAAPPAPFYIIRLSRLFGRPASSPDAKKSFVDTMLTLAATRDTLDLVDDEKDCPTYAPDLAAAVVALVADGAPSGIYHLPNTGACTWYEFGNEIFRLATAAQKISQKIITHPVSASTFPRPAERPHTSELLNTRRPPLRPWPEALAEYIATLPKI